MILFVPYGLLFDSPMGLLYWLTYMYNDPIYSCTMIVALFDDIYMIRWWFWYDAMCTLYLFMDDFTSICYAMMLYDAIWCYMFLMMYALWLWLIDLCYANLWYADVFMQCAMMLFIWWFIYVDANGDVICDMKCNMPNDMIYGVYVKWYVTFIYEMSIDGCMFCMWWIVFYLCFMWNGLCNDWSMVLFMIWHGWCNVNAMVMIWCKWYDYYPKHM